MSLTGAGGVSLGPCLHGVMSMRKKIVAFAIALVVAFSCLVIPVAAASRPAQGEHYLFCPHCGTYQLQGLVTKHDYCPVCGCYLVQIWGGGGTRGGGAGRGYYTTPDTSSTTGSGSESGGSSSSGSNNKYLTGVNNTLNKVYNIINETNNTINYVINNTTYNYTYNNYTYNNEYNYYTFNNIDNSTNYYVTNYVTYSVVSVPQEGTGGTTGNPVKYDNVILYYQLPDGRNSYNLTADDVFGTYFVYDMVNYDTVAEDDGTTLALYHFDGDLKDSSAHAGTATYTAGAEYNFVESTFGGALDWSETQHTLNFTLPEEIGTGDFTIEMFVDFVLKYVSTDNQEVLFNHSGFSGNYKDCSCYTDIKALSPGYFEYSTLGSSSYMSAVSDFNIPYPFFMYVGSSLLFPLGYKFSYSGTYTDRVAIAVPVHDSKVYRYSLPDIYFGNSFTKVSSWGTGTYWVSFVRRDGKLSIYINGLSVLDNFNFDTYLPATFTFDTDQGLTILCISVLHRPHSGSASMIRRWSRGQRVRGCGWKWSCAPSRPMLLCIR